MIPEALLAAVAALFGVPVEQLRSSNRTRYVSQARQAAAWVLRSAYPALSLQDIGTMLHRDHTTIIFSLKAVEVRMEADADLESDLLALIATVRLRSDPKEPSGAGMPAVPAARPGDDRRFWGVTIASTA
jgi:chromosomal replication initiator protein